MQLTTLTAFLFVTGICARKGRLILARFILDLSKKIITYFIRIDKLFFISSSCTVNLHDGWCGEKRGYFKDPADCAYYYVCTDSISTRMPCGPGTWFNELIIACDFPSHVNCTAASFSSPAVTPSASSPSRPTVRASPPSTHHPTTRATIKSTRASTLKSTTVSTTVPTTKPITTRPTTRHTTRRSTAHSTVVPNEHSTIGKLMANVCRRTQ
jgi:hypothetical protein